ncbi:MAG: hypothetical protein ACMUIP_12015 [bacterium]
MVGILRGTWLSLVTFDGGLFDLVVTQDPITGLLTGTGSLILNKLIPNFHRRPVVFDQEGLKKMNVQHRTSNVEH